MMRFFMTTDIDMLKIQLDIFMLLLDKKESLKSMFKEDQTNFSISELDKIIFHSCCLKISSDYSNHLDDAVKSWQNSLYKKQALEFLFGFYKRVYAHDTSDLISTQQNQKSFDACYARVTTSFAKAIVRNTEFVNFAIRREQPKEDIQGDKNFFISLRIAVKYYESDLTKKDITALNKKCIRVINFCQLFLENNPHIKSTKNSGGKKSANMILATSCSKLPKKEYNNDNETTALISARY